MNKTLSSYLAVFGLLATSAHSSAAVIQYITDDIIEAENLPTGFSIPTDTELGWRLVERRDASRGQFVFYPDLIEDPEKEVSLQWEGEFEAGILKFDTRHFAGPANEYNSLFVDGIQQPVFGPDQARHDTWYTIGIPLTKGFHTIRWNNHLDYKQFTGRENFRELDNFRFFSHGLDLDGDGMLSEWEYDNGLAHDNADDAALDPDNDGFNNLAEFQAGSNPNDSESTPNSKITSNFADVDFEDGNKPSKWQLPDVWYPVTDWLLTEDPDKVISGRYSLVADSSVQRNSSRIEWQNYFHGGYVYFDIQSSDSSAQATFIVNDRQHLLDGSTDVVRHKWRLETGWQRIGWGYFESSSTPRTVAIDNIVFLADDVDNDGDAMLDQWEHENGLDFNDAADALLDKDNDGLTNKAEFDAGADPNNPDSDGDGIKDGDDPFPVDVPVDTDGDGIPDSSDPDDDNDGVADDKDAFPLDAAESIDTDGDGIGNNADTDDDNDGVLDVNDIFPLDAAESIDTDGDGIGNNADTDDDNDGVLDVDDTWPLDSAESTDTDGDGIGNNADQDDDNDGVKDAEDDLPLDPSETLDTDGDGIGNNADPDDDGDGTTDELDIEPLNNKRWTNADTDGDGYTDDVETIFGMNPNDANDIWLDADGDHLPLILEKLAALDENAKDNNVFDDKRLLIRQAYIDVFREFASEAQYDSWLNDPTKTSPNPVLVYASLLDDAQMEHLSFIGRAYKATADQPLDRQTQRQSLHLLQNGGSKQDVVDNFIALVGFKSRYDSLSNSDFVSQFYLDLLQQNVNSDTLSAILSKLNNNELTRGELVLQLTDSSEYLIAEDKPQRVDALHLLLAGQLPDAKARTRHVGWLQNEFFAKDSIIRAILGSDVYRQSLMGNNIHSAMADSDFDGIPDGIEFVDGTAVNVKDNPVQADDWMFVKQALRDMVGETWSYHQFITQVMELGDVGHRPSFVESLMNDSRFILRQASSRLHHAFTLRHPSHSEVMQLIAQLEQGMTLNEIADAFGQSDSFNNLYGHLGNQEFVEKAFQNVLLRAASSTEMTTFKTQLDDGTLTKTAVLLSISEMEENKSKTRLRDQTLLLYALLYRRVASETEFSLWQEQFAKGKTTMDLIEQIIFSNEYFSRFD